ncbi:VOC family protein [[Mycobacterium] vasticus]|uniref:VOC family protein n=1 Tax=[Mycobacterium] vasticus TaxID=2875777 RepID=A0ABU5YTT0_9MYCO|nr:VOC family protein [Mycolicibacter sp. MYC017]MEB3068529.1 VOC family protein [Mycolicibacter sp. MYC017]
MRLNQVTIGSTDLDRAERFYRLLGLRLIVKTDHYLRFECPDGDSSFSVELLDAVRPAEQVTVYFECDDLDAEYQRLRDSVEFTSPPTDMPWLWREARLCDPDGHRLCLYAAGEARRNPPWRIDRSDQ